MSFLITALFMVTSVSMAASKSENVLKKLDLPAEKKPYEIQVETKSLATLPNHEVHLVSLVHAGEIVTDESLPLLVITEGADTHLKIVAKTSLPDLGCRKKTEIKLTKNSDSIESESTNCESISLDLAPYKINATETAIGVRYSVHDVFPTGEMTNTTLRLYRLTSGQLKLILETKMDRDSYSRGTNGAYEIKSSLSFLKKKTHDFYDVKILQASERSDLMEDDEHPITAEERHKTKKQIIFKWDQDSYKEVPSP